MSVTLYGDSIMKGVLLVEGKYHISREWNQKLSALFGPDFCNKSHFGCTIAKAMPSIQDSMEKANPGDMIIFEYGGNDCDYHWKEIAEDPDGIHLCNTPMESFTADYRELVRKAKSKGIIPVLVTLPPIDSQRYFAHICSTGASEEGVMKWLGDVTAIGRWQETYSQIVRQIAREEQTPMIDLRSAFLKSKNSLKELLCEDGIHPSNLGQQVMMRQLEQFAAGVA